MKKSLLTLVFVGIASGVFAQPITKWTARDYVVGGQNPISTPFDFVLGQNATCGLDPATITAVGQNPSKAVWHDPASPKDAAGVPTLVCVYTDPGTGPLLSTAFGGNYEMTLTATNSAGTSVESARAPFSHPGVVPSAPTGLRSGK